MKIFRSLEISYKETDSILMK